jgi:hypothetical protein
MVESLKTTKKRIERGMSAEVERTDWPGYPTENDKEPE